MTVHLLRLGHRVFRDQRITTHCALVARALGAEGMYYTGKKDVEMEHSILSVAHEWGGSFFVEYSTDWKKTLQDTSVHLTVYGLPYETVVPKVKETNVTVIVGGGKVPADVYQKATYNCSVTTQPHSEVAALALFLEKLELPTHFAGAKKTVIPEERGKHVVEQQ